MLLNVHHLPQVEWWRPLANLILPIPLWIVAYVYGIVAEIAAFIGWFAALFTGRLPDALGDVIAGSFRFQWRVTRYTLAFHTHYPSFNLPSGRADPGDDPAVLSFGPSTELSRLTVFFRGLLAIPQLIVVSIVGIAAEVAMVVAWFAVLFTGRWPEGLRNFVMGYFRWNFRVYAYWYLLNDVYPPFSMD